MTNYSDDRDFWQDLADSLFDLPRVVCSYYDEYEDDWLKKMELMNMNNGIDLDDLPVLEQGLVGRRALVKPKPVLQGRIHRPEIRQSQPSWGLGRTFQLTSFFRSCAEYLVVALKFTLLLTLGTATVVGIIFGGYLLLEAVVTWAFDAAAGLLEWLLSGIQSLAKSALEFVFALLVGAVEFIFATIAWIVGSIVNAIIDLFVFLVESIIDLIVGVLTFIFDAIVSILGFILEILLGFLVIIAIAYLVALLSPILIPLALLYFAYILIFWRN